MTNQESENGAVVTECELAESASLTSKPGSERRARTGTPGLLFLIAGAIVAALIGTWLVWLSAYVQRTMAEEEIRAACRRVMPETADRCFDTVIIQRGGARR
ncbi:MAG: hypothetical protein KatS3mg082_0270 [Nitrospiraceae bacterium]|nr:MAG: hypothetical protein KatS3mg082_0270 [Nitrospiraceae bacterium]